MTDNLRGLIERLEKLEVPSDLIDAEIAATLGIVPHTRAGSRMVPLVVNGETWPPYTASLDAAVSLVERVLPGCGYSVEHLPCYGPHHGASIWSDTAVTIGNGRGRSSAIALVIATLRALSQEQSK